MSADSPELGRFLGGEIRPSGFPHRDHVRVAFEMLVSRRTAGVNGCAAYVPAAGPCASRV
jgi:hypothetical protein